MNMKFRNYCIVIMSSIEGSLVEIEKVSEGRINSLNGKGILIATFSSVLEPNELTEFFKSNKRNFLIFDLDSNNSGFNIMNPDTHEGLFGFLKKVNLEDKAIDLINSINETVTGTETKIDIETRKEIEKMEISEKDIAKLTPKQKKQLFDEIFEKGVENFSENDKKILPFLVK